MGEPRGAGKRAVLVQRFEEGRGELRREWCSDLGDDFHHEYEPGGDQCREEKDGHDETEDFAMGEDQLIVMREPDGAEALEGDANHQPARAARERQVEKACEGKAISGAFD